MAALSTRTVAWHGASMVAGGMAVFAAMATQQVDVYAIWNAMNKVVADVTALLAALAPIAAIFAAAYRTSGEKQVPKDAVAIVPDDPHPALSVKGATVANVSGTVAGALLIGFLLLGSFEPAHAQLRKPQFTGNLGADIQANSALPTKSATPQKSLTDILANIAAKGTADLQAADDVASAIDPDSGKMLDMVAHACYPALIKFIGALPKPPADGTQPGPALIFERARLTRKLIQAGLPDYLKIGCAPLVQDEAGFFIKILALAGVTIGTGGLGALAIPAVPGLLSALPLIP